MSRRSGSPSTLGSAASPASLAMPTSPLTSSALKDAQKSVLGHVKHLVAIAQAVGSVPSSKVFDFGDAASDAGVEPKVGRKDVRKYLSLVLGEIKTFAKLCRIKPKPAKKRTASSQSGKQLKELYYVSDQLIDFLQDVPLGGGPDVLTELGLEVEIVEKESKDGKRSRKYVAKPTDGDNSPAARARAGAALAAVPNEDDRSLQAWLNPLIKNHIGSGTIFTTVFSIFRYLHQTNATRSIISFRSQLGTSASRDAAKLLTAAFGPGTDTKWTMGGVWSTEIMVDRGTDEAVNKIIDTQEAVSRLSARERIGSDQVTHTLVLKLCNYFRINSKILAEMGEPDVAGAPSLADLLAELKSGDTISNVNDACDAAMRVRAAYEWVYELVDKKAKSDAAKAKK
jgi:hypothetical protein